MRSLVVWSIGKRRRGDAVAKFSGRVDESLNELLVGVELRDSWERVDECLDEELLAVECHGPVVA